MAIVFIGIGSNLGNREKNIQEAISLLKQEGITILQTSEIIETAPVGGPPQGKYLNGVLKIKTHFEPLALLKILKNIEKHLGRKKSVPNAPRPIDLDILLYDDLKIQTPELIIPHPRMHERDFVLRPLRQLLPKNHQIF